MYVCVYMYVRVCIYIYIYIYIHYRFLVLASSTRAAYLVAACLESWKDICPCVTVQPLGTRFCLSD